MKEERKERKMKKATKKISRFPKKPEMLVRGEGIMKRKVRVLSLASFYEYLS